MLQLCDGRLDERVSAVTAEGGRLDDWKSRLEDGARLAGMKVADVVVTLLSPTSAFSTCIEFPASAEMATLLAVHEWTKVDGGWKLSRHQTIPWTDMVAAAGTLICDGRGCVSLVRSK